MGGSAEPTVLRVCWRPSCSMPWISPALVTGGGGARTGRAAPWLWPSGQATPAGSRARQRTATGYSPAPHHATDATPTSLAPPPRWRQGPAGDRYLQLVSAAAF